MQRLTRSIRARRLQARVAKYAHKLIPSNFTPPAYDPSCPQAIEFHQHHAKVRAIFGGNRASKSETGGYELVSQARKYPGKLFWVGAKSETLLRPPCEKIFKYLHPSEIESIAWRSKAKRVFAILRLKNGSEIETRTYKAGVESWAAASVKGIWMDEDPCEAIPGGEELYVEALNRTIDSGGQLWLTATPVLGKNWMFERLYEKQDGQHIQCWTVSLLDNKHIPRAEKDMIYDMLTEDEIQRRFYGVFTTLEGAVWKEFDASIHVIPRFDIPRTWRKIRAIDFGYTNPFVCLWIAQGDDGELYIYQEYYQAGKLIQEHAAEIFRRDWLGLTDGRTTPKFDATVADHDAQDRAQLAAEGLSSSPAKKDVRPGIEAVNRYFKLQPNGRPRLYIMDNCTMTIKEAGKYRYATGTQRDPSEEPIKKDDHTQDAMRYGVMWFARSQDIPLVMGGCDYLY